MNKTKHFDWKFFWSAIRVFMPIILAGIVTAAIGFVDNIFVSSSSVHDGVGADMDKIDLKAVGAGNEIFSLTSAFGIAASVLFGILFSQFINRHKDFVDTFKINMIFISVLSIVISLIVFLIPEKLIGLFFLGKSGPDKDLVIEHGSNFIKILSLGQFFYIIGLNIINPLTIKGKVKYGLYLSLVSILINAALDSVFIFILNWGAEGSAWATDIAYIFQFIIICYLLVRNHKWFTGWTKIFKFNIIVLQQAFKRFGIYMFFGLMQIVFALTTILWTSFYSSDLILPITTGYIIANLMFASFAATLKGVSIYIGPLLGDNKMIEARAMAHKLMWPNIFICFSFMAIAGVITSFFPALMINDSDQVFRAQWVITSFIVTFPAYIGVTYLSAIFEVGGMQWVPNFWNRGFPIWGQVPSIIIMSSVLLDVDWQWAFLITQLISLIPLIVIYFKFKRYKWLQQIKTSID